MFFYPHKTSCVKYVLFAWTKIFYRISMRYTHTAHDKLSYMIIKYLENLLCSGGFFSLFSSDKRWKMRKSNSPNQNVEILFAMQVDQNSIVFFLFYTLMHGATAINWLQISLLNSVWEYIYMYGVHCVPNSIFFLFIMAKVVFFFACFKVNKK